MGCQRPVWTTCFGFICVLVVPGAILNHMSVIKLIPAIGDLPDNIVKGFDKEFKFENLVSDSTMIKTNCKNVIAQCSNLQASSYCPALSNKNFATLPGSMSTTTAKTAIQKAFTDSLDMVNKIANDPYIGTAGFKSTADNLKKVKDQLNQIKAPTMNCAQGVPVFCTIWSSSDQLVKGKQQVNAEIDKFTKGDIIKKWDNHKGLLKFLHALPYFMVIALAFFAFFIWKSGVCCCCKNGTVCGSLANIPFLIFWLVSFIIYFIVFAAGTGIKYFAKDIEVPVLKGKPNLDVVIKHIQGNYKSFWDLVFTKLVDGLDILWISSLFFSVVAILIILYAGCECCCRPWQKKEEQKGQQKDEKDEENHVTV